MPPGRSGRQGSDLAPSSLTQGTVPDGPRPPASSSPSHPGVTLAFLGIAVSLLEGLGEAGLAGAGIGAVRAAPWWRPCCEVAVSQIDRPRLDEQSVHFSSANDFFFHVSADPTWAASPTSGSPWRTVPRTPTAAARCCGAPRKAEWQHCGTSLPRQGPARSGPAACSPVRLAVLGSLGVTLS